MKILLVNNHTKHLKFLNAALASHELEIVMYEPGVQLNYEDKDLIVLSGGGGEGLEIDDRGGNGTYWYQDQMELVMRSPKPILGICMGFEVISRAYGSKVEEMKSLVTGFKKVTPTGAGLEQINEKSLRQLE
jgi:anthranilate/para-aminobenzoate synthase component II